MSTAAKSFVVGDEVELAEALLEGLRAEGEIGFAEGWLWQYQPHAGYWRQLEDHELETRVALYSGSPNVAGSTVRPLKISASRITGAINIATAKARIEAPLNFSAAAPGVAFRDIFVRIEFGMLLKEAHGPDHLARHAYDFDFDESAPVDQFGCFLRELFSDVSADEAFHRVLLIQQFFGASLIGRATYYQVCLFLLGSGNNGKSTLVDILTGVFPPGRVCCVQPQSLRERFMTDKLRGALLNVVHELAEAELIASTTFKSVVSGEPVAAEKKYKDPYQFRPLAGHVFIANVLPPVRDRSRGFWRRVRIAPFTRDLSTLPTRRPMIAQEILEAEKPGIVHWLLQGALSAQQANEIDQTAECSQVVEEWKTETCSVSTFVHEECIVTSEMSGSSAIYDGYRNWCLAEGLAPVAHRTFTHRAKGLGVLTGRHPKRRLIGLKRRGVRH